MSGVKHRAPVERNGRGVIGVEEIRNSGVISRESGEELTRACEGQHA